MKQIMIIDARFKEIAQKEWGEEFFILPSYECKNVDKAISFHPDVSVLKVGNSLVCAPCVYDYYKEKLAPFGKNCVKGNTGLDTHYPKDCAYNIAITENSAIFKKGIIDDVAEKMIENEGFSKIYVNQGYAKCSCAVLKNAVITADNSIFEACKAKNIKSLKITEGHVALKPYDYGFLGGATGYFNETMFFFGDICAHPDYLLIEEFLKSENIKIKYIKNFPLTDIGTIIFP